MSRERKRNVFLVFLFFCLSLGGLTIFLDHRNSGAEVSKQKVYENNKQAFQKYFGFDRVEMARDDNTRYTAEYFMDRKIRQLLHEIYHLRIKELNLESKQNKVLDRRSQKFKDIQKELDQARKELDSKVTDFNGALTVAWYFGFYQPRTIRRD